MTCTARPAEAPTISGLHEFIRQHGLGFGTHLHMHHESYLGDPQRAAPENLRTMIRQPCDEGQR